MRTIATALLVGALSVPSLASAGEAKHTKDPHAARGIASVYSRHLVGHRTANGERLVTVTNRRNGRQATVRVNDRGPYTKRFLIDLSPAAAEALGMGRTGTTPVEIKVASAR